MMPAADCTFLDVSDDVSPASAARMVPALDEHNRAFWTGGRDGRLLITRCERCHLWVSPPAGDCPECGGRLRPQPVSGLGTVFTYTVNHQPFNPAVAVPYVIAIVELDEQPGLRIAANIVDCQPDSVHVGLPVAVRFERQDLDGEIAFAPVFAPR
ncbi:putative nucleic-acid-binding protein containing a Zn-ribbon [Mycolicibacterium novocastrense]|uniref:Nucleic-acid-binding protein containing a Zn-ribbon n=2 Tax=Mycolicibacterium novocastrense TaxID=59813 RepID=A0ABQ0KDE3_MYCNV|nr:putative nucleic-acid-binding protein containing a Zn-ribbon [Mycolicibacterium novocastrense]